MTALIHTPKPKAEVLKKFLKTTKRPDERDRARAVLKLIEGKTRQEVADFFDKNIKTIDEWQRNFKQYGIDGLCTVPQQGNKCQLSETDKEAIKTALNQKTPEQVGLQGKFWTLETLKTYVKQEYDVTYKSDNSYYRLFKFCGFSCHKPDKVNQKQSAHMRKRFEDTLKKSSKSGKETKIVWYW